jgi:hypothetical protein
MLLRGKFQEEIVKKNIENYFCYLCRYREFFAGLANIRPLDEVWVSCGLYYKTKLEQDPGFCKFKKILDF